MAFVKNSNQQLSMSDSRFFLTDREKKRLQKSWAEPFYRQVFSAISEERFEVLYSDNTAAHPNTPVNVIIGALILKEQFCSTDEELMDRMIFDALFQHALGTSSKEATSLPGRARADQNNLLRIIGYVPGFV